MRRGPALAAVALAALTAAGCAASPGTASPAAPSASPAGATTRLFERDTGQASIDLGTPGAGPGDLFVFSGDVFDGGPTGPRVGRADGSCTTTSGTPSVPGSLICQVTFSLHGGQLDTQAVFDSGPFFGGTPSSIAVTGGTGTYRDARGDGTATVPDVADPSAVVFALDAGS